MEGLQGEGLGDAVQVEALSRLQEPFYFKFQKSAGCDLKA